VAVRLLISASIQIERAKGLSLIYKVFEIESLMMIRRAKEILRRILEAFEGEFWRNYVLDVHKRLNYSKLEFTLFIVACSAATIGGAILNPVPYSASAPSWLQYLKYVWLFYLPISLIIVYSIYRFDPSKDFGLQRVKQRKQYKVIFQIVTRGVEVDAVRRGVLSVMHWAPQYLKNFEIWVVTEEDAPKSSKLFFEELKRSLGDKLRVIYVPRSYRTPKGTLFKARALCYALDVRRRLGYVNDRTWVYLMDEESVVGEDTILSIVEFIEGAQEHGKMAAQGLVVYSNFWGKSVLPSIFDSVRPLQDVTLMRFQYEYGRPLFAVHGSHMLIRTDLEDKVGWDFGPVMAEDLIFGLMSSSRVGRVWGWLRGKLYEQSPFSVVDFFKQRRRWVWGIIDILRHRDIDAKNKFLVGLNYLLWLGGLPAAVISILNLVMPTPLPTIAMTPFLGLLMAVWLYMYWEGCKINTWHLPIPAKVKNSIRLAALILAPLAGLFESAAVWYGIVTYPFSRRKVGFELVKK